MKIQNVALFSTALFLAVPIVPAASYSIVRSFGVLTNVTGFQPQSSLVHTNAVTGSQQYFRLDSAYP